MITNKHHLLKPSPMRLSLAATCLAALLMVAETPAEDGPQATMDSSAITFWGKEGWAYQLKGKTSLADSDWEDVGLPVWGANESVSIPSPYPDSGFFIVESSYIGGGNGFDFSKEGPFDYTSAVYASTQPANRYLKDSSLYNPENITPGYEIERSVNDVSAFLFPMDPFPINGLLRIPVKEEGAPPSPLAILVHGMRDEYEAEKGFRYLCEQLASHGIITATIDEYMFNDEFWGQADGQEDDARAIVLLEHVKQFGIWNKTPGHPLEGKVDMSQVMLLGLSRGGEAVEIASYFQSLGTNTVPAGLSTHLVFDGTASNGHLGPYNNFTLKALVAIAPLEGTGVNGVPVPPVKGNYLLLQGSSDEDMTRFRGYKTYERANPVDPAAPWTTSEGCKALVWIHGANHAYFNTEWKYAQQDPLAIDPGFQREIAKYYITAFARSTLLDDDQAMKVFQDNRIGDDYLVASTGLGSGAPVKRVTQFHGRERLSINHFQEDTDPQTLSSAPAGITGTNSWTDAACSEELFSSVAMSLTGSSGNNLTANNSDHGVWAESDTPNNRAVYCVSADDSEYTIRLDAPLDITPFSAFSFDVANDLIDPADSLQIEIRLTDAEGTSVHFDVADYAALWDPTPSRISYLYLPTAVMQTVYLPIADIKARQGFDPATLRQITLRISDSTEGTGIYFDNLEFVK